MLISNINYKIIIFTENEPHYVLPLIEELCRELSVAAIVVSDTFGNRTIWENFIRFIHFYVQKECLKLFLKGLFTKSKVKYLGNIRMI